MYLHPIDLLVFVLLPAFRTPDPYNNVLPVVQHNVWCCLMLSHALNELNIIWNIHLIFKNSNACVSFLIFIIPFIQLSQHRVDTQFWNQTSYVMNYQRRFASLSRSFALRMRASNAIVSAQTCRRIREFISYGIHSIFFHLLKSHRFVCCFSFSFFCFFCACQYICELQIQYQRCN